MVSKCEHEWQVVFRTTERCTKCGVLGHRRTPPRRRFRGKVRSLQCKYCGAPAKWQYLGGLRPINTCDACVDKPKDKSIRIPEGEK